MPIFIRNNQNTLGPQLGLANDAGTFQASYRNAGLRQQQQEMAMRQRQFDDQMAQRQAEQDRQQQQQQIENEFRNRQFGETVRQHNQLADYRDDQIGLGKQRIQSQADQVAAKLGVQWNSTLLKESQKWRALGEKFRLMGDLQNARFAFENADREDQQTHQTGLVQYNQSQINDRFTKGEAGRNTRFNTGQTNKLALQAQKDQLKALSARAKSIQERDEYEERSLALDHEMAKQDVADHWRFKPDDGDPTYPGWLARFEALKQLEEQVQLDLLMKRRDRNRAMQNIPQPPAPPAAPQFGQPMGPPAPMVPPMQPQSSIDPNEISRLVMQRVMQRIEEMRQQQGMA